MPTAFGFRFYTLDGASEPELSCHGWLFTTTTLVRWMWRSASWRAAIAGGVDYLASDQYELLGAEIHQAAKGVMLGSR